MTITIKGFTGEIPATHERMLPQNAAAKSINAMFRAQILQPVSKPLYRTSLGFYAQTIFKDGLNWLGWAEIVDVARGPVAQDRLYITGSGTPKMRVAGVTYALALPAPTVAPTVVNLTSPGAAAENALWCYTWVTEFDEESQPSPLSTNLLTSAVITQRIYGFGAPPSGRGVNRIRIYRSQTSASGATDLFFATEISVATTTLDFTLGNAALGESLSSSDYDTPDPALQGIVSMPNGMMAAFVGNELFFSEPYRPHAWPSKYAQTVDAEIVGLAAFGSSLAVLTRGAPYVAQGLAPDVVAMEKIEGGSPCLSRRGIIDLGYAALYPSVDGLMLVAGSEARNVTANLFTREQWQYMSPETMIAQRYEGQYVFSRRVSQYASYDGGTPAGWPTPDVEFDTSGPTLAGNPLDYVEVDFGDALSAFGDVRIGNIDTGSGTPTFTDTDFSAAAAMYFDPVEARTYIADQLGDIYEWRPVNESTPSTLLWRSKLVSYNMPISYGAVFVRTERPVADGDVFKARVYGNGGLVREVTKANRIERLPGSKSYEEWQIEIESSIGIAALTVAQTPDVAAAEMT